MQRRPAFDTYPSSAMHRAQSQSKNPHAGDSYVSIGTSRARVPVTGHGPPPAALVGHVLLFGFTLRPYEQYHRSLAYGSWKQPPLARLAFIPAAASADEGPLCAQAPVDFCARARGHSHRPRDPLPALSRCLPETWCQSRWMFVVEPGSPASGVWHSSLRGVSQRFGSSAAQDVGAGVTGDLRVCLTSFFGFALST
ncbi:hypothetical protein SKAU_G00375660 [Synaphobranchus kaupii]|uniref:Uncharacterized protein n=1 Tax=Synaphobranchus kaupii TaxID=118154 RepID=A0A9Q1EGY8_SYNKA|nr:hypothetical protein SKAU_G00375660 [Synaphobranchus kaupii]